MGIENPTNYDLRTAGLTGMGSMHGDVEALEDIGIPATPETFESHVASAAVAKLLTDRQTTASEKPLTPAEIARKETHDFYVRTHGVMDGPLVFATPEEQAANTVGKNAAIANIRPMRPTK